MIGNIGKREQQTTDKSKKMKKSVQLGVLASVLAVLIVVTNFGFASAETGNPTILATDEIKNNPKAMSILQTIELFKKQYAAQHEQQGLIDMQQKQIEEKRKIANENLQKDLISLNDQNNPTNPKNAFASFVAHVNNSTQNLFWDEYSFMQQKVQNGRNAMQQVLQNGGTIEEALQAYSDAAKMHKTELVTVNKNLNIKYNLADATTQKIFDKFGRHPIR